MSHRPAIPLARKYLSRGEIASSYLKVDGWADRVSSLIDQVVAIPAYEDRAKEGNRAPHRFCWRGVWYRVEGVVAEWLDGRNPLRSHPEYGRHYYNVLTDRKQIFQIYFDRTGPTSNRKAEWVLYKSIRFRGK